MGLVIDTSVIINAERNNIDFNKWQNYEEAYISSITVSELLLGVHKAKDHNIQIRRSAFVEHIINSIEILYFGVEESRIYAQLLYDLYSKNITLGAHDLIIGATAIANGYPVLTMNIKDFKRIASLEVIACGDK